MSKFAVFHIEGGIGKNVAATAVIEAYKREHTDRQIIVVTAWSQVFENNPNVDRVYIHGQTPYFYKDYIYNKDVVVFAHDPYKETPHVTQQQHLIETWCEMVGVGHKGELPRLSINFREEEIARNLMANDTGKPILLFQPFGGPGKHSQEFPYSWTRDIHPAIAQSIVNVLSQKYHVVHICYDFHPTLNDCVRVDQELPKNVLFALLNNSDDRILVDSSLQHAAVALNKRSTVVWVATNPTIFGYELHRNVTPNKRFLEGTKHSYLFDYNFTGDIGECPYNNPNEIFNASDIIGTMLD